MKILALSLICILMTSSHSKDLDFIIYLESFRKAALDSKTLNSTYKNRLDTVIIKNATIDEISDSFVAYCDLEENVVYINTYHFINMAELKKQQTIDHELGHCVLMRSHYNLSILSRSGEKPTDIMHHSIFNYESQDRMNKMRRDLFKKEYYGTILEFNKVYKEPDNSSPGMNQNIEEIRLLEHRIMQERIELYKKKNK